MKQFIIKDSSKHIAQLPLCCLKLQSLQKSAAQGVMPMEQASAAKIFEIITPFVDCDHQAMSKGTALRPKSKRKCRYACGSSTGAHDHMSRHNMCTHSKHSLFSLQMSRMHVIWPGWLFCECQNCMSCLQR